MDLYVHSILHSILCCDRAAWHGMVPAVSGHALIREEETAFWCFALVIEVHPIFLRGITGLKRATPTPRHGSVCGWPTLLQR